MENNSNSVALVDYKLPAMESHAKGSNYTLALGDNEVTLKRDVDFMKIEGKGKRPSLSKSGAEKILLLFGLRVDVEIVFCQRDFTNGFFYYEFKATAYDSTGKAVRVGYGNANTSEKSMKSSYQSGFDVANSCIKKAEKRAIVDLALKLGSCSDLFYQDLEDDENIKGMEAMKGDSTITKAQLARLFAICSDVGISSSEAKDILAKLGYQSAKDILNKDYDNVCEKLKSYVNDVASKKKEAIDV
jgi:hypothetical protein